MSNKVLPFLLFALQGCIASSPGVLNFSQAVPAPTLSPSPTPSPAGSPYAKICTAGASIDCSEIAAIWTKGYSAVCASDGTSYDVSGCLRVGDPTKRVNETVHPAERDPRWANAKCSYQGNYDFQISIPPHPDGTWVISFQGGSFCAFDGSGQGGCSSRESNLVQTNPSADRALKNDPDIVDPDFSNSIWVYNHYCSNDQWSGTNLDGVPIHYPGDSGPVKNWTFTGHYNVKAMLEILRERYGLNDAAKELQIFAVGASSGGWGLTNNAYQLKSFFPRAASKGNLMLASKSGFVPMAWNDPNYPVFGIPGLSILDGFDLLRKTWSSVSYPACVSDYASTPQACLSGSTMFDYITGPESNGKGMDLPLLVFQNRQDQLYMSFAELPPYRVGLPQQDIDARNAFVSLMNTAMGIDPAKPNQSSRIPWLFAPSDPVAVLSDGSLEPNVHPPLEYDTNPPDGVNNSLQNMQSRFWRSRGRGPGRGLSPGEVHTYDCNWVPNHNCL